MKINEVEALVNITKKNIRFYEEQGLLNPKRNSENGYRDYSEEDIKILQQIKLLRKLGVSIEEIRQMLKGTHTLGDGMRRHLITLERDKQNLEHSIAFCKELQSEDIFVSNLNADELLNRMEHLEKTGATFQNKQANDVRIHYVAPAIVTVLTIIFMAAMVAIMIWAYAFDPADAPPIWFLILFIIICVAVMAGVVLALTQRIREIGKGEIEDAKRY